MSYKCEILDQSAQPTLTIRTTTSVQQLPQVLGEAYGKIAQYLGEIGQAPTGAPFAAYYNMDMQNLDVEIGFPIAQKIAGKGEIQSSQIPAGRVVACTHIGQYAETKRAYAELMKFIQMEGLEAAGVAYEFYLNDPSETPPEELKTQIVFPIK